MGASANECCPYVLVPDEFDIDNRRKQSCPLSAAIAHGNADMVNLLLKNGANPNGPIVLGDERIMQDWREYLYKTPLVVAAECASLDIVKVLLQYGADPNWTTFDTLQAPEKRELIRKCYSKQLGCVKSTTRILILYPLQAATSLASREIAEFLLNHGARANPVQGTPPLSIAALFSRTEIFDLLIRGNALITLINVYDFGMSPLEGAVLSESQELVKRLISAGADPNECSAGVGGKTPFQRASDTGSASMFETLVGAGATLISSSVPDHATKLLQGFVRHQHYDITMKLLQQGANPDANGVDGMSLLSAAIGSQDLGLVSLLLKWGADPSKHSLMLSGSRLDRLNVSRHYDLLHMIQSRGSLVPPLYNAVIAGSPTIVTYLYDFGADVGETNTEGSGNEDMPFPYLATALHMAVLCEDKDLVELLLARGAKINYLPGLNPHISESPLSVSIQMGHRDITELLLRNGADPNDGCIEGHQEDEKTRTDGNRILPLEEACFRGDSQMTHCLMLSGANVLLGYPLVWLFRSGNWIYAPDPQVLR